MSVESHSYDFRKHDNRVSSKTARYMELFEAAKGGDCRKVKVANGVSPERGCCDLYEPATKQTIVFNCGHCQYLKEPK